MATSSSSIILFFSSLLFNHLNIQQIMQTIESQLSELRLSGMKKSWQAIVETRRQHDLNLVEGIEILLDAELIERGNRRTSRLTKNAAFRYQATIEQIRYDASRGLDKSLITSLSTGNFISEGSSVIITGATGCGKSYLASALGHQACMLGYKVAYYNVQKLMMKTRMARIDGSIYKFFDKTSKTDLLILDDFGLTHLEKQQQLDFMELIEDRHGSKATILASQLPLASWFDIIGEETIADAILDRLVHTSYKIELKGESLRKNR
jgi:DNA replication protein DnaC